MRLEYFQLIDRIVELDLAGQTIRARADVPQTTTIFEGHFPGHPIMPGVLLIEAMAQTAGWLVMAAEKFEGMAYLAAVREAKLRAFVGPGEVLSVSAQLVHQGSGYAVAEAAAESEGKTVCNAEIMFRVVRFPNAQLRAEMVQHAQRIGLPMERPADA
jgi:3-hydroxyacyl-[acyl-carrier-protein] dehydratase